MLLGLSITFIVGMLAGLLSMSLVAGESYDKGFKDGKRLQEIKNTINSTKYKKAPYDDIDD